MLVISFVFFFLRRRTHPNLYSSSSEAAADMKKEGGPPEEQVKDQAGTAVGVVGGGGGGARLRPAGRRGDVVHVQQPRWKAGQRGPRGRGAGVARARGGPGPAAGRVACSARGAGAMLIFSVSGRNAREAPSCVCWCVVFVCGMIRYTIDKMVGFHALTSCSFLSCGGS